VEEIKALPLQAFDFHGFKANRRVISYGWRYDFTSARLIAIDPIPGWLLPVREAIAQFAGDAAEDYVHVLISEYAPGAGIGWPQGQSGVRPYRWCVIGHFVSAAVAARRWRAKLGGSRTSGRAWIHVFAKRRSPERVGAQHRSGPSSALFPDLSYSQQGITSSGTQALGGRLTREEATTMNTANLQLEGLYLCIASLSNALVAKGVMSRDEIDAALASAQQSALTDFRADELSDSNRDAVAFPARVLRAMNNSASATEIPSFSEIAKLVGQTKDGVPTPSGAAGRDGSSYNSDVQKQIDPEAAMIRNKIQETAAKAGEDR